MIALMLCIGYSRHTKMKRLCVSLIGVIITIVILSAVCLSAGAQAYLRGDADGDGEITSVDATVVQRVVAGLISDEDGSIAERACVTEKSLSVEDATRIQMFLANFDNRYHIGENVGATETIAFPTEDNQLPILKG